MKETHGPEFGVLLKKLHDGLMAYKNAKLAFDIAVWGPSRVRIFCEKSEHYPRLLALV